MRGVVEAGGEKPPTIRLYVSYTAGKFQKFVVWNDSATSFKFWRFGIFSVENHPSIKLLWHST